jgi:hypothetical protein
MNLMKRKAELEKKMTVIYGILCIVLLLVILQLWLLTATMNAFLGGEDRVIWPAFSGSLFCFLLNLGLLYNLYALDKKS